MIAIVDYGLGNIRAFANVYKTLRLPCKIATTPQELTDVTKVILPGVGAFDYAMQRLQQSGMQEPLTELVRERGVPVLGICVGMQMLAASSEEGGAAGLGWIKGEVKRFDVAKLAKGTLLPHMGWNNVSPCHNPLFEGLDDSSRFYFLHSYYFQCQSPDNVIATTDYGGTFASAVNNGNIYGVQFHPEKSHQWGVRLLQNFGEL